MNFTGQHRCFIENIPAKDKEIYKGLIVCANKNKYFDTNEQLVVGKDAITINDSLPYLSLCTKDQDKSCFGVVSTSEDKEVRETTNSTLVGVFSKQSGDYRYFINSVGEGAIWVCNKNGNLESGDYITTASIPGYGQKQDSEFLANYTVGKITIDCDFNPPQQTKQLIKKNNISFTIDASGNYIDTSNNERIFGYLFDANINAYTETNKSVNPLYNVVFEDDTDQVITSVTKNILDANGELQWEDSTEQEYAYEIRYIDATGTILTESDYNTKKTSGQNVYIAAFIGCTYHCG